MNATPESDSARRARRSFEDDLAARANPERSRLFSREALEASRAMLLELAERAEWLRPAPLRHPSSPVVSASNASEGAPLFANARRISVVGSNGKGSTAGYLAGMAAPALRDDSAGPAAVGLYTSPHLFDVLERIRVNGKPISAQLAWDCCEELRNLLGGETYAELSYFELLTLVAVRAFRRSACRFEVYEAGLGGRFDATLVARAEAVALTKIELEHTQILGATREQILEEKLGILSPRARRFFALPQRQLAADYVLQRARAHGPGLESAGVYAPDQPPRDYLAENRGFARWILAQLASGDSRLSPDASLFASTESIAVPDAPGRLEERATASRPVLFFDTAHNAPAIAATLAALAIRLRDRGDAAAPERDPLADCLVVAGLLADRDPEAIGAALAEGGCRRIVWLDEPGFAPPPPSGLARVHCSGAETVARFRAGDWSALGCEAPPRQALWIGTHRSYKYFLELADGEANTRS